MSKPIRRQAHDLIDGMALQSSVNIELEGGARPEAMMEPSSSLRRRTRADIREEPGKGAGPGQGADISCSTSVSTAARVSRAGCKWRSGMVELLIPGTFPNNEDVGGSSPVLWAAKTEHLELQSINTTQYQFHVQH